MIYERLSEDSLFVEETLAHLECFAKEGKRKLFRIDFPFVMLFSTVETVASMHVTDAQALRWARGSLLVCETLYAFCLLKNKWFPKQTLSRHY